MLGCTVQADGSARVDLGPSGLDDLAAAVQPDAVVLGPGMEEFSLSCFPVLNNPPHLFSRVSDKLWLYKWLKSRGFPAVPTWTADERPSAKSVVVKPIRGAGGVGCFKCGGGPIPDGCIGQEFVPGVSASASVISDGKSAVTMAVNEQLIGLPWLGASGFRYCGNVTPLSPHMSAGRHLQLAALAEEIVGELGLMGSNGVDFVLGPQGPVVLEVNPRFQGSLDTVEQSTGANLFTAHMEAFQGVLPKATKPAMTAGRGILYAARDIIVERELEEEDLTDLPSVGTTIHKGQPVVSILSVGRCRQEVLENMQVRARHIFESCQLGS